MLYFSKYLVFDNSAIRLVELFPRFVARLAARRRPSTGRGDMPLVRGRQEFVSTVNGVEFLMHDGRREVACRATLDLLRNRFGSQGQTDDERMFVRNRDAIENAASAKYRAGNTENGADPEILVTESDMASPLSQKL